MTYSWKREIKFPRWKRISSFYLGFLGKHTYRALKCQNVQSHTVKFPRKALGLSVFLNFFWWAYLRSNEILHFGYHHPKKQQVQLTKQIFLSTRHVVQDTFWKSSLGLLLNDCLISGKLQPRVVCKSVAYKKSVYLLSKCMGVHTCHQLFRLAPSMHSKDIFRWCAHYTG